MIIVVNSQLILLMKQIYTS